MILYIIKWTFIYVILIFLLHNLYLFFQDNLTTTKNKDYYNNVSIESYIEKESINSNINSNINTDFTYQMKDELNDFIIKMKNEK